MTPARQRILERNIRVSKKSNQIPIPTERNKNNGRLFHIMNNPSQRREGFLWKFPGVHSGRNVQEISFKLLTFLIYRQDT